MDNTTTESFRIIQIIYGSIIMGVLVFFLFTIYTVPMTIFEYNDGSVFVFLVPIFFIGGFLLSDFLFNKSISKIIKTDSFFQKLTKYQRANIMRGAPLEGAGLVAVVAAFTTMNSYYLIYATLAILLLLLKFPSKYKFENTVDLSFDEKDKLSLM